MFTHNCVFFLCPVLFILKNNHETVEVLTAVLLKLVLCCVVLCCVVLCCVVLCCVLRCDTVMSGTTFIKTRRHVPKSLHFKKCVTVGTNYHPSHQASTSVSTCSIYTGDKHKTGSPDHFATIAKAASLLWLNLFGSSTYFTLRCPTGRHMTLYLRSSGMLQSSDWYLVTDVWVPSSRVTSPT